MQTFIFTQLNPDGTTDRIEKTEQELTQKDKDFLFANLLDTWNRSNDESRIKLVSMLQEDVKEKAYKALRKFAP